MLLKFFLNFFLAHKVCLLQYIDFLWFLVWQNFDGNFENEALENEDRSTKHPKLENEAPKTRKRSTQMVVSKTKHSKTKTEARSTQISKTKHPKLETCLCFKNMRQSLVKSPAAGIKHDNK